MRLRSLILFCLILSGCSRGTTYKRESAIIVQTYQDGAQWYTTVRLDDGRREIEQGNLGEKGDHLIVWVWE